jgi:hypothetical protein
VKRKIDDAEGPLALRVAISEYRVVLVICWIVGAGNAGKIDRRKLSALLGRIKREVECGAAVRGLSV